LEDVPARDFLKNLGSNYENVKAVMCISAHWITSKPKVNAVENLETIHDYYGFPPELYNVEYSGKGHVEWAQRTANLLNDADVYCDIDFHRGLDHGAWVPMNSALNEFDEYLR
jgi:4,5-DOPA dioxygenase extradiol